MIGKWFDKLVFMVLENHGWSQVQTCKFINYFQQNGTIFTNWEGATHPSGPNYRALLSGQTWSTNEFDNVQRPNVAAQVPYTVYSYANDPAQRHNPFLDMNPGTFPGCIAPTATGYTLEENLIYLGMDDQNDAHSGPLEVADQHVIDACNQFQQLCHNSIYAPLRMLMFVTFDEAFGIEYLTNHVFTGILTHNLGILPKQINQKLSHYNFAATLAENWNIDLPEMNPLGNSASKPFYLNI